MTRLLLVLLACLLLAVPARAEQVNINTAGQAELETLPGIGPSKAAAIIAYRQTRGPFTTVAQLDDVQGIGPATLSQILPLVTIGGGVAPVASAPPAAPPAPAPRSKPSSSDLGLAIEPAGEEGAPAAEPPRAATRPAAAATGGARVNINTASASELDQLPGIGASKAAAIVADRDANGPFGSCADLDRVQGIGPSTVANLEAMCTTK